MGTLLRIFGELFLEDGTVRVLLEITNPDSLEATLVTCDAAGRFTEIRLRNQIAPAWIEAGGTFLCPPVLVKRICSITRLP